MRRHVEATDPKTLLRANPVTSKWIAEVTDAVLECHATSGAYDYMLKIVAPDMAAYQDFLSAYLLTIGVVRTVNTSFVLKEQKSTTVLPLAYAKGA